jgi:hypothetical protein
MSLTLQVSLVISELGKRVTEDPPRARWLLLIYRVPQDPPGPRTYAWRQLKQLGAICPQQAAASMPDRPDLRTALGAPADRTRSQEGDVSLLETTSPSAEWESDLVERFNLARDGVRRSGRERRVPRVVGRVSHSLK